MVSENISTSQGSFSTDLTASYSMRRPAASSTATASNTDSNTNIFDDDGDIEMSDSPLQQQLTPPSSDDGSENHTSACTDPSFVNDPELIHQQTFLCTSNFHIDNRPHYSCIECENSAYQNLEPYQQDLVSAGGCFQPFCNACGNSQSNRTHYCTCLKEQTKCSQCLQWTLHNMEIAKMAVEDVDSTLCLQCEGLVEDDAMVSKCVYCHGIKITAELPELEY